ncbi:MAG: DUF2490 domain-containing protein [Candidatus Kapabacteria bacterium]|nr:DUF2490 domain-containing protein [Candidatus Kapabacteria bacterium]
MMLKILLFLLIIIYAAYPKTTYPIEDRQAWFEFQFEYDFTKKLSLEISEELRYYKNYSRLSQALTDLGLEYDFTDFFKAGLFYRYRINPDENEYRNEIYTNLSFKLPLGLFVLTDRTRIHIKFRHNESTINNLRNMLTLQYELDKNIKPYISAELFYRFFYEKGDRLTQGRYYIGSKFKLEKQHQIDIFFMREQEYNTNKAIHSNVLGLGYKFTI